MPKTATSKRSRATKKVTSSQPVIRATLGNVSRSLYNPDDARRPSLDQILRRYGRYVHRCLTLNAETAAAVCPKLFVIGGKERVEKMRWLRPRPLDARTKAFLRGSFGNVRPGAVAGKMLMGNIDDLTEVMEHPALMLLDNVNEWEEGFGHRQGWYSDLGLFGRLFDQIVSDNMNTPIELWRMLPNLTDVVPDPVDWVSHFLYGREIPKRPFAREDVFWVKNFDPFNPWGGIGWVEAWLKSIDADFTMAAFNQWLFNRGGAPDFMLMSKAPMSPAQKQAYEAKYRSNFGNLNDPRRSGIAFHDGEGELVKISQTPREMQYHDSRIDMRDEICIAAGIPKSLMTTDDVNRANAAEGNPQYIRGTIWPMIQRVEDAINQRLLPRWSERLVLIHENPLKEDEAIVVQKRKSKLESGWSINEVRLEAGEEKLDDPMADEPMVAAGIVPLKFAGMSQMMPGMGGGMGAPGEAVGPDGEPIEEASPKVEITDEQSPAVATNDLRATVGGSAAILSLQEAYYGGKVPREAAIGNAVLVFGFTQDEAEKLFPEKPPDAPKSESQIADEEAAREVMLNPPARPAAAPPKGTMGGDARDTLHNNRSSDDAANRGSRDNFGNEVVPQNHSDVFRNPNDDSAAWGAREGWSDSGIGTDVRLRGNPNGRGLSLTASIYKAWEGVEHEIHNHGGRCDHNLRGGDDAADSGIDAGSEASGQFYNCWKIHSADCSSADRVTQRIVKADSPQSDLPDSGSVRGFIGSMDRTLREQVDVIIASMKDAASAAEAVSIALQVVSEPIWIEKITEAARPFLERAIKIGGEFGIDKLRTMTDLPEAVGFDVSNPEVQRWVDRATSRVAYDVGKYTTISTRELLGEGLANGETIDELTRRVERVYGTEASGLAQKRAARIARTESARAYVAGEEESWKQSGVVESKEWMLASDPCEFCEAAALEYKNKAVPLGGVFYPKNHMLVSYEGNALHLDYEDVTGPPLHPNCRCDLMPVLIQENQ